MSTTEPSELPCAVLIEDDPAFRAGVQLTLQTAGWAVQAFAAAEPAMAWLARGVCDAVLTDLRLPDGDGLSVLAACRQQDPDLPVLMMTGHGDVPTAVRAMREGAYDFLEKPFDRDRLLAALGRALQQARLARENRGLRTRLAAGAALAAALCGDSAAMQRMRALILQLAPTPVDVLITGETGTGKELVARALHDFSDRRGPFVPVNCAALPEPLIESELFGHEAGAFSGAQRRRVGRIEHAHTGTLFLDEIEAMPAVLQAKLLRVLQEREVQRLGSNERRMVDLRVLAASNLPLQTLVNEGRFRADLFYRLNVAALALPPLRERREDVLALFEHFRAGAALRFGRPLPPLPPRLGEQLLVHEWPGNVRELKSAAERQVLGLPALGPEPLADAAGPASLQATLEALEALLIEDCLRRNKGQPDAVCQALALSPATLYRKLKQHGLALQPHREA